MISFESTISSKADFMLQKIQRSGSGKKLAMDRYQYSKYLGMTQACCTHHALVKAELREKVKLKFEVVLRTKLA